MYKIDKILIGTHNDGKFREMSDLLPNKVEKISPKKFSLESPVEDGKTFSENSEIKANYLLELKQYINLVRNYS